MSRLIVVSNRVAPPTGSKPPGGLAVGVEDALRASGGIWLGWSGEVAARAGALQEVEHGNVRYALFPLTRADYDRYYRGFANAVLWPVFHYRPDLSEYLRADYEGYLQVNRAFVRRLQSLVQPDDLIWVHDYHLLPLGQMCREAGMTNRIGFFLHIPFPALEVYATVPPHRYLAQAMCAYDVLGFQTEAHAQAYVDTAVRMLGAEHAGDRLRLGGREVRVGAYPIGIDVDDVQAMSRGERTRKVASLKSGLADRRLIISVDRLDYSKGMLERFEAFAQMLESRPAQRGKVSFVQIAPSSRSDVHGYREIRRELEMAAGHINGRWSELAWTPLRYINRPFDRAEVMPLMRASQVGFVTPLRDGMNLVAKEYVAAQPPEDPGVLVLSQFAGAADELRDGALIVNPYDIWGMADALDQALRMPLRERRNRHARLMAQLRRNDLRSWKDRFLADLEGGAG
ncbi:alpha,alpha-trehalose-phosphate synthase (UDP-forming) [Bordetella sp. 2513F-2]